MMQTHVMESLQRGMAVFLCSDLRAAPKLSAQKNVLRRLENEMSVRPIRAPRERRDKGGAGDVSLRIVRNLRRIHSHLAALAHRVREHAGLLKGRLIRDAVAAPAQF